MSASLTPLQEPSMGVGRMIGLALVTLFVTTRSTAAAVTAWTSVDVRVYDATGMDATLRRRALAVANVALAAASVEATWQVCVAGAHALRCDTRPTRSELAIRIVQLPITAPPRDSAVRLGDAYIDRGSGRGVLATIYLDRVVLLSHRTGSALHTLLGRAIAHELGHLLMANNAHGAIGLMRGFWSEDELRSSRAADWTFSSQDAHAIEIGARNIQALGAWGTN